MNYSTLQEHDMQATMFVRNMTKTNTHELCILTERKVQIYAEKVARTELIAGEAAGEWLEAEINAVVPCLSLKGREELEAIVDDKARQLRHAEANLSHAKSLFRVAKAESVKAGRMCDSKKCRRKMNSILWGEMMRDAEDEKESCGCDECYLHEGWSCDGYVDVHGNECRDFTAEPAQLNFICRQRRNQNQMFSQEQ